MIRAKKKFGQNFLKDPLVKKQIIQAIPELSDAKLIEIGPGLGDLTHEILQVGKNLTSYEIDDDLIDVLKKRFENELKSSQFTLIHGDFMREKIEFDSYFICANLPYYISSQIIVNALLDARCTGLLVMVQKELANRFLGSDFGALSVLANTVCECELIASVPPSAFEPAPKVDSSVIRLIKKPCELGENELKNFNKFLKMAFASPRKKVLSSLCEPYKTRFKELGFDPNLRAHEVSVKSFLDLYKG